MRIDIFFIIIFFSFFHSYGQKRNQDDFLKKQFSKNNQYINYRILEPYHKTNDDVPLFIFLHGAGERGDDNEKQLAHGSRFFLEQTEKKEYNSYVVLPQCPDNNRWSYHKVDPWLKGIQESKNKDISYYGSLVIELIENLIENKNIDPNRIYISGLSMGGYGTFDLVSHRNDLFAAAAPICGGSDLALLEKAVDVPFWIFHGDLDRVVPVEKSRDAFNFLINKRNHHKYTEYIGVYHNSWENVFEETDYFMWLFSNFR